MGKFAIVDKDSCIACGACNCVAPEIFDYDDEGISLNILDDNQGNIEVPEKFYEDLEEAEEGCPVQCIKVAEQPFGGDPFKFTS
ncbi:ferredoxin [Alteribacillus sp. YIM 98480]|uniref:ferredoxin n=1 Tax=Alteribacillus sp. YIM 98480 TaxID=2606599 RepID=UPI00131D7CB4|nr:ferredoxin [Alteribacillus sp. YIM 98480]